MSITSNVTLPIFETASADFIDGSSHSSFAVITTEMEVYSNIVGTAELIVPNIQMQSLGTVALSGNYADLTVPSSTLDAQGGANGELNAPSSTIDATATIQNIGRAEFDTPNIVLTTLSTTGAVCDAEIEVPSLSLVGYGSANSELRVPSFSLDATGTTTGIGSASITVPGFSLDSLINVYDFATGELVVPGVAMLWGIFENDVPSFSLNARDTAVVITSTNAYAINTTNNGITEYQSYGFDNILRVGDTAYGVIDNVVYLIGGDLDIAAEIDANFETHPLTNKDMNTKNIPYIYIAARTEGTFQAGTVADEIYRNGAIISSHGRSGVYNYRAKFGRGVKATHWGFTISNVDGADFQIQSIEPLPLVHRRRL